MWHFSEGYVIIQIDGLCAARFMKRMTDSGIRVSDVHSNGEASVRLSIPAKRFFLLRKLKRGLPVRIRIIRKGGLPFFMKKLFRRPVLWIGTCVLFFALLFLQSRIWVIRVEETVRVDPDEVLSLLSERGIYPGASLSGPILITAANDLSAQIHDAAWIGLDREGVMLKVNVVETLPESLKRSNRVPSDIVAEKDGVITSIQVMRGQPMVKVGDHVKAGDVLISGTVTYKDSQYQTSADGMVYAAINYQTECPVSDRVRESYETGETEIVRAVTFADWKVLSSRSSFEHYRLTDTRAVSVSSLFPIRIEQYTAREIGFRERTISDEEAEQNALSEAREQAFDLVPHSAAIINIYGTIKVQKEKKTAIVIMTSEELIGKTEVIPHDG